MTTTPTTPAEKAAKPVRPTQPTLRSIPVDRIDPDPEQPRKEFTDADLDELAASMRHVGQLQPVLLRANPADSRRYLIVVGERRWRAAQRAGLPNLTATVTKHNSASAFIAQVAENVNRKDMTPMEEAAAYAKLSAAEWKTEKIADLFGKSAAYIGWRVDLLGLVPEAQDAVNRHQLPINTAWYVCKLDADAQRMFLARWAHGEFPTARDAEEFAKAYREANEQGELFTPEVQLTEDQREQVRTERRKLVSDIDRLSMAGELLLTLANADPAHLAQLLAGADGGVGAYRTRVEHLGAAAGKAAATLRKAQAIAAAAPLTLDLDNLPDAAGAGDTADDAEAAEVAEVGSEASEVESVDDAGDAPAVDEPAEGEPVEEGVTA